MNKYSDDKARLKDRLISEGRWRDFVDRREELKRSGLKPYQANRVAATEFPPLVAGAVPVDDRIVGDGIADDIFADDGPPRLTSEMLTDERANLRRDIEWVYNRLDVLDVEPGDAPSPGAWSMLTFFRQAANRPEFYSTFLPRLLPSKNALEEGEENFKDDGRVQIELCDRLSAISAAVR